MQNSAAAGVEGWAKSRATRAQLQNAESTAKLTKEQIKQVAAAANELETRSELNRASARSVDAQARIATQDADFYNAHPFLRILKDMGLVGPLTGAAGYAIGKGNAAKNNGRGSTTFNADQYKPIPIGKQRRKER